MKRILIFIVINISALNLFSQNAKIEGIITISKTDKPLSDVSVYLDNTDLGTVTNGSGYYSIDNIKAGKYVLTVSNIGYFTVEKEVILKNNDNLKLDISLTETISALSEVTVTGGTAGIKEISGAVHYISLKDLRKNNYNDINRILATVPGVNIREEDGFGLFPNIGLRGTGVERNTKITVMEDGVLAAPAPYSAPAAYYFPAAGRMQGIEIIKGSSQIEYGPYTTGGAINLISTQIPEDFFGRMKIKGGSFGTYNVHSIIGDSYNNFAYLAEIFQYGSNGFKKIDMPENKGYERSSGFEKHDYLIKFRLNTNPDGKIYQLLDFKAGLSTGAINETYLGLTPEDFKINPVRRYAASQVDEINTVQSQFSVTHKIKLSDFLNITTIAYRTNFKRNWYKLDSVEDSLGRKIKIGEVLENHTEFYDIYQKITGDNSFPGYILHVKANNREYYSKGIQTTVIFNFNTSDVKHNVKIGVRFHQYQIDRFQWIDEYVMTEWLMRLKKAGIHGDESNKIETANAAASFIRYKFKKGKLTLSPGLRFENISQTGIDYGTGDTERIGYNLKDRTNIVNVFMPGMGIDYKFNSSVNSFAAIHKGFAPPGSKPEVKPEESINYETGVRFSKNGLFWQSVFFFNDYKNLLGSDLEAAGGNGTNEQFNGGAVKTKGIEFNMTYDLFFKDKSSKISLPVSLVYTYTDARFQNSFKSAFEGWGEVSAGDFFRIWLKTDLRQLQVWNTKNSD